MEREKDERLQVGASWIAKRWKLEEIARKKTDKGRKVWLGKLKIGDKWWK